MAESRELTAVERFAKSYDPSGQPAQSHYYRDLIPVGPPGVGEQYAFEVDLDSCSGCKACVSACHHLNGLQPEESWRSVGLLNAHDSLPVLQHVTTACHHCIDPGCLNGCPTGAYQKSPKTGIVRHLDDQCFGCQYCVMMCPYEVPQYSPSMGIVRKCDMCSDRLSAGEAPACVQGCPNQAIRITLVDVKQSRARTTAGEFLRDTPPSNLTHPTTRYNSKRGLPDTLVGADYRHAEVQHAHPPLVAMLILTQMAVGALAACWILRGWASAPAAADCTALLATSAGLLGLAVAPLHLGRPHLAYRAVLNWRSSWLSREAIVFGLLAPLLVLLGILAAAPCLKGLAVLQQPLHFFERRLLPMRPSIEAVAVLVGLSAVFCSAQIYLVTGRKSWRGHRTLAPFFLTVAMLGLACSLASACWIGGEHQGLAAGLVAAIALRLAYVSWANRSSERTPEDLTLTVRLLEGPLHRMSQIRTATCLLGGAAAGLLAVVPLTGALASAIGCGVLAALVASELTDRWLYFASAVPLRMPGGLPAR